MDLVGTVFVLAYYCAFLLGAVSVGYFSVRLGHPNARLWHNEKKLGYSAVCGFLIAALAAGADVLHSDVGTFLAGAGLFPLFFAVFFALFTGAVRLVSLFKSRDYVPVGVPVHGGVGGGIAGEVAGALAPSSNPPSVEVLNPVPNPLRKTRVSSLSDEKGAELEPRDYEMPGFEVISGDQGKPVPRPGQVPAGQAKAGGNAAGGPVVEEMKPPEGKGAVQPPAGNPEPQEQVPQEPPVQSPPRQPVVVSVSARNSQPVEKVSITRGVERPVQKRALPPVPAPPAPPYSAREDREKEGKGGEVDEEMREHELVDEFGTAGPAQQKPAGPGPFVRRAYLPQQGGGREGQAVPAAGPEEGKMADDLVPKAEPQFPPSRRVPKPYGEGHIEVVAPAEVAAREGFDQMMQDVYSQIKPPDGAAVPDERERRRTEREERRRIRHEAAGKQPSAAGDNPFAYVEKKPEGKPPQDAGKALQGGAAAQAGEAPKDAADEGKEKPQEETPLQLFASVKALEGISGEPSDSGEKKDAASTESNRLFSQLEQVSQPAAQQAGKKANVQMVDVKREAGMACPNCGSKSSRIVFCPYCGSGMCTNCSPSIRPETDRFVYTCPHCGEEVNVRKKAK